MFRISGRGESLSFSGGACRLPIDGMVRQDSAVMTPSSASVAHSERGKKSWLLELTTQSDVSSSTLSKLPLLSDFIASTGSIQAVEAMPLIKPRQCLPLFVA